MEVTGLRNIRLLIEYDGTDFSGWQIQTDRRTVQGELEKALGTVLNRPVDLVGAGRTDTGVHALGQVANFRTNSSLPVAALQRGGNSLLPDDIVIRHVEEVDSSFHARFDATARRYLYRISSAHRAIGRQYVWHVPTKLEVQAMREAARCLAGRHDFTSFCSADSQSGNPICNVFRADWADHDDELVWDIEADHFLQHMVRTLVGTLVDIGRGRWPASFLEEIMKARDRAKAGLTAPAQGLCLIEVKYPNRGEHPLAGEEHVEGDGS